MNIQDKIIEIGKNAKIASNASRTLTHEIRNNALQKLIINIKKNSSQILSSNKIDIANAHKISLSAPLINRLTMTEESVDGLIKSIEAIIKLPDPINKVLDEWTQPNGLIFKKISIPIGVIGVIYESRPNVTIDAACIALKSGNCLILRGGKDSFNTSNTLVKIIAKTFEENGLPKDFIQMVPFVDREGVDSLIQMKDYVDVIIPRGGKNLIEKINSKSSIPVIKHLDGICHVFIDKEADIQKAKKIILNSKMRRPEICGATETLLIDKKIKQSATSILEQLLEAGCEIRGDEFIESLNSNFKKATEKDWATEYLDKILSVKLVDGVVDAVNHINKFSSGHTEAIVTENEKTFKQFYNNIDSAIILKNASTQFADGGEFGFGAEIGISTDKLHVRGPVGPQHLTSFKYIVHGNGHERSN